MSIRVRRKPADAYQHGDLRHALIQAGLKLLSEGGLSALSLRAAAQLAGVSHAAPYRHFKDKEALVAAIAEEGFRLLTRRMKDELAKSDGDLLARLRASGVGYVAFAVEHPGYFRVIFGGAEYTAGAYPGLDQAGQEAYLVLRDLVSEGITQGRLRAGDPDQVSLAAWSLVHGLGMLIIDGNVPPPLVATAAQRSALAEGLLRMLEGGLAAPALSPPRRPTPSPAGAPPRR
jgi:AcrR family transcriptional regulator